jgi:hypothetical protein
LRKGFRQESEHRSRVSRDAGVTVTGGSRTVQHPVFHDLEALYLARAGVVFAFALVPKSPLLAKEFTNSIACRPALASKGWLDCSLEVTPWTVRACGNVLVLHDQSPDGVQAAEQTCSIASATRH